MAICQNSPISTELIDSLMADDLYPRQRYWAPGHVPVIIYGVPYEVLSWISEEVPRKTEATKGENSIPPDTDVHESGD